MSHPPRVIVHVDMDAFYAAVEIRENPALAGIPLIIGHPGRRGVVSTCSYEARRFGVHSAMPSLIARAKCPDATWLPGRMDLYVRVSREIRRVFDDVSPRVEPISIDEAFCDLTGIARDLDDGCARARVLQQRILKEHGLSCSLGIAPNKFLAKIASDMDKPAGVVGLAHADLPERLWPLGVERLWGVGPRTAARLRDAGLTTIGDLARVEPETLALLVGRGSAAHLAGLAVGHDDRPVVNRRRPKSISEERTYGEDLVAAAAIDRALLARAEGVARQLRRRRLLGRTVHLKIRLGDFTTWTRATTLPQPTDLAEPILQAARGMLRDRIDLGGCGVRLIGVGVSGLDDPGAAQQGLFTDPDERTARRIAKATDAVRNRIGERAVTRARLLRPGGRRKGGEPSDPDEASSLPSVD